MRKTCLGIGWFVLLWEGISLVVCLIGRYPVVCGKCVGRIVIQWGGYLVRLRVDWEDILIERYLLVFGTIFMIG